MAVKWAVANGNWNVGITWNDGVIPTANDDVYLNGHTITLPNSAYTAVALSISNGYCSQTGGSGGCITGGQNQTIVLPTGASINAQVRRVTANVTADAVPIFTGGNHVQHIIVGNVEANAQLTDNSSSYFRGVNIIGNITANSYIVGDGSVSEVKCAGNVTANYNLAVSPTVFISIVGTLACFVAQTCIQLTINGQITYKSSSNTIGVIYTRLNILNPDTFTWKDLTEPRSNPFIILTDAEMNNRQQYPAESDVKKDVPYAWGAMTGIMESGVQVGCVTKEDVREGVALLGMDEVGTLVVPSADDVREGVVFDNGSVGTLIVEGGGDRLRIADFGYYTNAQSDTYIVDLTEQDKPKFAVAEERVLIEMFPDLDLDNIPDKYFDDLFVKYLKYRLIVEYYRTAGINSTFTPSEPTTEIVNYQNVRNEVWLNSANIYLKAWAKKYPESITKPQRILL